MDVESNVNSGKRGGGVDSGPLSLRCQRLACSCRVATVWHAVSSSREWIRVASAWTAEPRVAVGQSWMWRARVRQWLSVALRVRLDHDQNSEREELNLLDDGLGGVAPTSAAPSATSAHGSHGLDAHSSKLPCKGGGARTAGHSKQTACQHGKWMAGPSQARSKSRLSFWLTLAKSAVAKGESG